MAPFAQFNRSIIVGINIKLLIVYVHAFRHFYGRALKKEGVGKLLAFLDKQLAFHVSYAHGSYS